MRSLWTKHKNSIWVNCFEWPQSYQRKSTKALIWWYLWKIQPITKGLTLNLLYENLPGWHLCFPTRRTVGPYLQPHPEVCPGHCPQVLEPRTFSPTESLVLIFHQNLHKNHAKIIRAKIIHMIFTCFCMTFVWKLLMQIIFVCK